MKQDQVVAVEVSHRVMKNVSSKAPTQSITDLSQSIRIEQELTETRLASASDDGRSSVFRDARIRVEFLGKIHLSHTDEAAPDRPAYKTPDGHTLH